jgi:hypothetical protein
MKPHDLEKSFHAFLTGVNPNDPKLPKSALVLHNKWGIPRKQHEEAVTKSLNLLYSFIPVKFDSIWCSGF